MDFFGGGGDQQKRKDPAHLKQFSKPGPWGSDVGARGITLPDMFEYQYLGLVVRLLF